MDNKLFDVNGRTPEQLENTLKLLLDNEYGETRKVEGWLFDKEKGFVLYWHTEKRGHKFPVPIGYKALAQIVYEWLQSEEAGTVTLGEWEDDCDHDGSNELGFRVYLDEWGHININGSLDHYTLGAIKPVYCWYGK